MRNRVSGIAAVWDCIAVTSDDTIPAVILMNKEGHTLWATQFDSSGKRLFALPGYIIHRKINGVSCLMVSDKEKHTITTLDAKTGDVLKVSSMFKGGPNVYPSILLGYHIVYGRGAPCRGFLWTYMF